MVYLELCEQKWVLENSLYRFDQVGFCRTAQQSTKSVYYTHTHIYTGCSKKLCFMFLLISQLILILERRVGYPQNWHGKRFPTICDSAFSVT